VQVPEKGSAMVTGVFGHGSEHDLLVEALPRCLSRHCHRMNSLLVVFEVYGSFMPEQAIFISTGRGSPRGPPMMRPRME